MVWEPGPASHRMHAQDTQVHPHPSPAPPLPPHRTGSDGQGEASEQPGLSHRALPRAHAHKSVRKSRARTRPCTHAHASAPMQAAKAGREGTSVLSTSPTLMPEVSVLGLLVMAPTPRGLGVRLRGTARTPLLHCPPRRFKVRGGASPAQGGEQGATMTRLGARCRLPWTCPWSTWSLGDEKPFPSFVARIRGV